MNYNKLLKNYDQCSEQFKHAVEGSISQNIKLVTAGLSKHKTVESAVLNFANQNTDNTLLQLLARPETAIESLKAHYSILAVALMLLAAKEEGSEAEQEVAIKVVTE